MGSLTEINMGSLDQLRAPFFALEAIYFGQPCRKVPRKAEDLGHCATPFRQARFA